MTFRFAYPLLLLLVVPLIWYAWTSQRSMKYAITALRYSDLRLIQGLPISWRVRFRWLPDVLRTLTWILLVIALARPQGGHVQQIIRGQGVDIVLGLDISGSMAALDFAPQNRLAAAKSVMSQFIEGRNFDRIGLVVFARNAFQQIPPTLDYRTLLRTLDQIQLSTQLGLEDGTAIGLGIAAAGNMLRSSDAKSKVIILLTDGANNAGQIGPLTSASAVAAFGIRVYTIGVGKDGRVPVPIDDMGNTQLIESDLDEAMLQEIAQSANAHYFRAEDLIDLQAIYEEINRLERSDMQRQVVVNWQELSDLILFVALVSLIFERILRHTLFQTIP